jgi:hypothetical protein
MPPIRECGGEKDLRAKLYHPWGGEGFVQVTGRPIIANSVPRSPDSCWNSRLRCARSSTEC